MSTFKKITPFSQAAEKAMEADLASAVANDLGAPEKTLEERMASGDARIEAMLESLSRQRKVELIQIQKLDAEKQARLIRIVEIDKRIAAGRAYLRQLEAGA